MNVNQIKGGKVRAKKLSSEQRREIAIKAAQSRWQKSATNESNFPKALYTGVLPIGDVEIDCAVLDDGRRVLTATSIFNAFDRTRKGMNSRLEIEGTKIPPFLAAKNLEKYTNNDVKILNEKLNILLKEFPIYINPYTQLNIKVPVSGISGEIINSLYYSIGAIASELNNGQYFLDLLGKTLDEAYDAACLKNEEELRKLLDY